MNYRKSRRLMWWLYAAGVFAGFSLVYLYPPAAISGVVLMFAGIIQAFIFYRCPHCGSSLMDIRGTTPAYCPRCGKKLD